MYKITLTLALLIVLWSCKDQRNDSQKLAEIEVFAEESNEIAKVIPLDIQSVFDAHGGIDKWNTMNNLCFEMEGGSGIETHTISLKDRKSIIETRDWSIGSNGETVWLKENQLESYDGNARFYHNLMFYFYAMPFVLADDGINYEKLGTTELVGKSYESVKVSYEDGIGDSPKDEYILYFDPETKAMSWLAYTVTFRNNEKSDNWKYIKYSKWNDVNGLTLPKTLTWYNVEEGKPTEPRNEKVFDKITVTETVLDDKIFNKPADGMAVER